MVLDQKVMDQKVLGQKVLGQKVLDDRVLDSDPVSLSGHLLSRTNPVTCPPVLLLIRSISWFC